MSVQGSLAGVRVVEIGTSVAVPFGCQILGDFGAEVIKVERLGTGDEARMWAPLTEGVSVTFLSLNRNKKSVVLNYKADEGKQALEELLLRVARLGEDLPSVAELVLDPVLVQRVGVVPLHAGVRLLPPGSDPDRGARRLSGSYAVV